MKSGEELRDKGAFLLPLSVANHFINFYEFCNIIDFTATCIFLRRAMKVLGYYIQACKIITKLKCVFDNFASHVMWTIACVKRAAVTVNKR